jgi:hypothetical protein
MPRGRDSAGDPRRRASIHAAMAQQMARRAYLFGNEAVNQTWETDFDKMNDSGREDAVLRTAMYTTDDVAGVLMKQDLGGKAGGIDAIHREETTEPDYGMTKGEWNTRQEGGHVPTGIPSSSDPFAFGKHASESETETVTALKRGGKKGNK